MFIRVIRSSCIFTGGHVTSPTFAMDAAAGSNSLPGWNDDDSANNMLFWAATAIAVTFVIQKVMFRADKRVPAETPAETGPSATESRLLRQQFGVLPDDNQPVSSDSFKEEESDLVEPEPAPTTEEPIGPVEADDLDECTAEVNSGATSDVTDETKPKPKKTRAQLVRERLAAAAATRVEQNRPCFQNTSDEHPGLAAFWHWCDVETSLFRIYTITRKDNIIDDTTIAPYNPSSRRGTVPINLTVTNELPDVTIKVFWIDFKGKHIEKGTISPNGGTWHQNTWIDHPWIFCETDQTTGDDRIILHYIPYKAIPNESHGATDALDSTKEDGVNRFSITSSPAESLYSCIVIYSIFPHPASAHVLTPHKAAEFALLHCNRMSYNRWPVLKKYVNNILLHPENTLCRQIRTSNPTFAESVWNSPAKGVLLAAGFIEHGAYVEFGSTESITRDTAQDLSLLLYAIELWERRAT